MFERLPDASAEPVEITIDGEPFVARSTDSVAAAILASGRLACRVAAVNGAWRGPYCLMGTCFDCLVTIDGRPNQQGCLVPVSPGMRIEMQRNLPSPGDDAAPR